nr:DUF1287 domain-containing protein [Paenimyroides cloacae]
MKVFLNFMLLIFFSACTLKSNGHSKFGLLSDEEKSVKNDTVNDTVSAFRKNLSKKALSIIDASVKYTPDYIAIEYPNGDVPAKMGVCTDVVIRSYRKLGIDLQKEVHEDILANFNLYPNKWGAAKTDTNIDHRRVPNLETFFKRKGKELPITQNANDYKTGAIVTWMINDKLPHIGLLLTSFQMTVNAD